MRRITPVLQRDAKVNRVPHNHQREKENNTLKEWMDGWAYLFDPHSLIMEKMDQRG